MGNMDVENMDMEAHAANFNLNSLSANWISWELVRSRQI